MRRVDRPQHGRARPERPAAERRDQHAPRRRSEAAGTNGVHADDERGERRGGEERRAPERERVGGDEREIGRRCAHQGAVPSIGHAAFRWRPEWNPVDVPRFGGAAASRILPEQVRRQGGVQTARVPSRRPRRGAVAGASVLRRTRRRIERPSHDRARLRRRTPRRALARPRRLARVGHRRQRRPLPERHRRLDRADLPARARCARGRRLVGAPVRPLRAGGDLRRALGRTAPTAPARAARLPRRRACRPAAAAGRRLGGPAEHPARGRRPPGRHSELAAARHPSARPVARRPRAPHRLLRAPRDGAVVLRRSRVPGQARRAGTRVRAQRERLAELPRDRRRDRVPHRAAEPALPQAGDQGLERVACRRARDRRPGTRLPAVEARRPRHVRRGRRRRRDRRAHGARARPRALPGDARPRARTCGRVRRAGDPRALARLPARPRRPRLRGLARARRFAGASGIRGTSTRCCASGSPPGVSARPRPSSRPRWAITRRPWPRGSGRSTGRRGRWSRARDRG